MRNETTIIVVTLDSTEGFLNFCQNYEHSQKNEWLLQTDVGVARLRKILNKEAENQIDALKVA